MVMDIVHGRLTIMRRPAPIAAADQNMIDTGDVGYAAASDCIRRLPQSRSPNILLLAQRRAAAAKSTSTQHGMQQRFLQPLLAR
jgi:hypothetical protein